MIKFPRDRQEHCHQEAERPFDIDDCVRRARRWHGLDQPRLALSRLARWIAVRPEVAEFWYYRAVFCGRLGLKLEEARSWRTYLRLQPGNRLIAGLLANRLRRLTH